jgi:hypothetical protein
MIMLVVNIGKVCVRVRHRLMGMVAAASGKYHDRNEAIIRHPLKKIIITERPAICPTSTPQCSIVSIRM